MDIPIRELRLSLEVLAHDPVKGQWQRLGDKATLAESSITHLEDIQGRLCRELRSLWRRSKTRWWGRYAFSLAHVRLEMDTAKVSPSGHCEPQSLFMERDFPLDGTVALDDFGEHMVAAFGQVFEKFLTECGRQVYGAAPSRQRIQ